MKKKTKRKNPADLTKRNNDARKKEIKQIKSEIKLLWLTVGGLLVDVDRLLQR